MSTATIRERPIIFGAPMVRALLEGRKTQTRRVVKPEIPEPYASDDTATVNQSGRATWHHDYEFDRFCWRDCPFGAPETRLWVRETWGVCNAVDHVAPSDLRDDLPVVYRASSVHPDDPSTLWRSPIHMPRWASRITLEITGVRVERLQSISEADAYAEGVTIRDAWRIGTSGRNPELRNEARCEFRDLWHTIHKADGPHGWEANPWLWVLEFRRVD